MAKQEEAPVQNVIDDLFKKAVSDPDSIPTVSKYIRTGKRWDLKHNEVMGKLLVIKGAKEINTKYGPAQLVQVDVEGLEKQILFGGQVLFDQIVELGVNLPVLAVIRKPARSYTLSDPTPEEIESYRTEYRK